MDWAGWSSKLAGTLTVPLLPRLVPLEPYEESCLRKARRLRRGPDCEDCRRSRLQWKTVEVEIDSVVIYRPFGEFHRANSYCHLYGAQGLGQRQAYF
ncbi:hypothetical protein TNCV_1826191 [Trichonephila clavipes]|nr:hypothetical protein TNCV_1826191 [Trichonephila clavipes]